MHQNREIVKTDVLIIGAGFAGIATAFHLSRSFSGSILVVEQEDIPAYHASGRNASLVLQCTEIPEIRRALVASRQAYESIGREVGFDQKGSLLLGTRKALEELRQADLPETVFREPAEVVTEIPLLEGHRFEAALWTPSDGVMDISRLLQFYLREAQEAGVRLRLKCRLLKAASGPPFRVETTQGAIEAQWVINAAGGWAAQMAREFGAAALPLVPYKRHLFVLEQIEELSGNWPFVWNIENNFYFRPESGGLLFSICDESRSSSLEPTVSSGIWEALAELIHYQLPRLSDSVQRTVWSCFRTKAPDGRFVIGWDPQIKNFFWVAALGGHGMGSSWEVGRLAAQAFLEPGGLIAGFEPGRFPDSGSA